VITVLTTLLSQQRQTEVCRTFVGLFNGGSTMLSVGDKAPQFTLNDGDGKKVKLSEFKGKKVVLYFYPKDLTPGCTVEACAFRDDISAINKLGSVVLGVSADSEKTHRSSPKHDLNFPACRCESRGL
jgi:peroxiredoxin Q/BCP